MKTKLNPQGKNQTEIEKQDGTTVFFSYSTPVAAHVPGRGFLRTAEHYSTTTTKHINAFLARNGGSKFETVPQSEINALA